MCSFSSMFSIFCVLTEREMEFSTSNLRQTFILQKTFSGYSECVQYLVGQAGDIVSWCDGLSLCWLGRHLLWGWRIKDEPNKEKFFCVYICVPVHLCIYFQTENNHSSPLRNLWPLSFSFFLGLLASSKREISLPLTRIKKLPQDFTMFLVLRFVIKIYSLPQGVTIYVKNLCLKNLRVVFWILIMIL